MSYVFGTVLIAILAGNGFWWRRADRSLRGVPHAVAWRWLLGVFMGGQIVLILWIIAGRVVAEPPWARPPQVLSAAAYLWHLLVLPTAWVLVGAAAVLFWVWRTGRRVALRAAPAAAPAAGIDES